jgi:hypothetical protein
MAQDVGFFHIRHKKLLLCHKKMWRMAYLFATIRWFRS